MAQLPQLQGDAFLYQTLEGVEFDVVGGEVKRTAGIDTTVYLALLGGNYDGSDWWANQLMDEPAQRLPSCAQYVSNGSPLSASVLPDYKRGIEANLKPQQEAGVLGDFDITLFIESHKRLNVKLDFKGDESLEYAVNWTYTVE